MSSSKLLLLVCFLSSFCFQHIDAGESLSFFCGKSSHWIALLACYCKDVEYRGCKRIRHKTDLKTPNECEDYCGGATLADYFVFKSTLKRQERLCRSLNLSVLNHFAHTYIRPSSYTIYNVQSRRWKTQYSCECFSGAVFSKAYRKRNPTTAYYSGLTPCEGIQRKKIYYKYK